MVEARSFPELVAERLRKRREELGLTQDDVARRCTHRFGLEVSRSVVDAIERGARDLTLPELAVVLAVLDLDLAGVLRDRDVVALSDLVAVRGAAIVGQVSPGLAPRWTFGTMRDGKLVWRESLSGYVATMPDESERKAAAKLGITPERVAQTARRVWGVGLTEERERRVAGAGARGDTLRALRGHVTRELLEELAPEIESEGVS